MENERTPIFYQEPTLVSFNHAGILNFHHRCGRCSLGVIFRTVVLVVDIRKTQFGRLVYDLLRCQRLQWYLYLCWIDSPPNTLIFFITFYQDACPVSKHFMPWANSPMDLQFWQLTRLLKDLSLKCKAFIYPAAKTWIVLKLDICPHHFSSLSIQLNKCTLSVSFFLSVLLYTVYRAASKLDFCSRIFFSAVHYLSQISHRGSAVLSVLLEVAAHTDEGQVGI